MLLKQKNVVTKVPESVHPAAIKNVLIEDKKIVFYKKHPKNDSNKFGNYFKKHPKKRVFFCLPGQFYLIRT